MKALLLIVLLGLLFLAVVPSYKPSAKISYAKAVITIGACFASFVLGGIWNS
ncbi:hypothetical protein D3C76_1157370 [compost metagenome]